MSEADEFQQILYLCWLITVYQRQIKALVPVGTNHDSVAEAAAE